ncbi:MAG: ATP-binding protein [Acidimicrobiales bacterium]|nr:ATP-binding protein [Acidimicrobiales bacterium]
MTTRAATVELTPAPQSAGLARRFVREQVRAWGVETDEDDVALMVSELVTNVGLHARTEALVSVSVRDGCLRVEVTDRSDQPVEVRPHALGAETGRGLRIVDALAADWGVQQVATGKTVWFEVPALAAAPETMAADGAAEG